MDISAANIQEFTNEIDHKQSSDVNDFLLALGKLLKLVDPDEVENEVILRTVDLLYAIHKHMDSNLSNIELTEDIENIIIDCKGTGAALRRKLNANQLDSDYYTGISKLGREIVEFAQLLSLLGIFLF